MVVTATGMATEVGHISGMLSGVEQEKTPLTQQLDQLTVLITIMAAAALVLIVIIGLDPRRGLRRAVPDRHQPGDRRDPDRPAGGRHDAALARDAGAGREGRDREAAAVGRDARLDVGDLLGQDRHADAQPDDGAPARRSSAAATASTARATRPRADPARRRRERHAARAVPAADGARQRRRHPRRRDHRRPDRGGARRPRGQGRPRRRGDAARLPARGRGAVRRRVQADGDVPRDGGRRPQGRALLRQGRPRRAAGALVARSATPTARTDPGRRRPRSRPGRERPARRRGAARAGGRRARLRPGRVRPRGPLLDVVAGADAARPRRHRRPAAQGGEGRDRALQGGRHPRPDDHRRPRDDGGGDRAASSASRAAR